MKKNLFYYLFTVICSVTLFASCSDDDEKVVNPVTQTTFTGENGLQLTYNGAPMLGKKVTFTPDATNAQKATLRLEGEFDLNGILGGKQRVLQLVKRYRCLLLPVCYQEVRWLPCRLI